MDSGRKDRTMENITRVKYEVIVHYEDCEARYIRTAPEWKYRQDRKMYEELKDDGTIWGYQILYKGKC